MTKLPGDDYFRSLDIKTTKAKVLHILTAWLGNVGLETLDPCNVE